MLSSSQDQSFEILLSKESIQEKIKDLGQQIDATYTDTNRKLVVISVLKGALVFTADLIRAITRPIELHMLTASSYGASTTSSGHVKLTYQSFDDSTLKDADILLVDDITDTGRTLLAIGELLNNYQPHSVRYCTFLNKPSRREVELSPNFIGFDIEDKFVVGYGLDYAEKYRELPYIGVVKE